MRLLECDVVVVGAGPAGSMAAKAAAEGGADVFLLEEHPQVGYPIYCAEGLSLNGIRDAGLKPEPPLVSQEITKARVYAPDRNFIDLTSSQWNGYNLNREFFDRAVAENAVESGAELMTSTVATRVLKEGGRVSGVQAVSEGEPLNIEAKVVVGADGHASVIRRTAGLGRWFPDVCTCAQYRLGGLKLEEPEVNEFYLGSKVSPGGYAWVFPKSEEVANVGLGVRRIHTRPPIYYLKRFVDSDPRFSGAKILMVNGGITPVSGVIEKAVGDGVMLTGDAAGQLIAMTGAGIHSGLVSGGMAGEVAAKAVSEGDTSSARLSEYERLFDVYWGKRIRDSRRVVEMLDRFSDEDFNTLATVITKEDIISLANGEGVRRTLTRIVARAPGKIIRLLSSYLHG